MVACRALLDQTRLTSSPASDSGAVWSPGGRRIAFCSNRNHSNLLNYDIYQMNPDGRDVKQLTDDPEYDVEPKWSPDGSKLLFMTGRNGGVSGNFDIYVMNADGSNQTNLNPSPKAEGSAVWSPNGRNIAFNSTRDGHSEVYVMEAEGRQTKKVTNQRHTRYSR